MLDYDYDGVLPAKPTICVNESLSFSLHPLYPVLEPADPCQEEVRPFLWGVEANSVWVNIDVTSRTVCLMLFLELALYLVHLSEGVSRGCRRSGT